MALHLVLHTATRVVLRITKDATIPIDARYEHMEPAPEGFINAGHPERGKRWKLLEDGKTVETASDTEIDSAYTQRLDADGLAFIDGLEAIAKSRGPSSELAAVLFERFKPKVRRQDF